MGQIITKPQVLVSYPDTQLSKPLPLPHIFALLKFPRLFSL